MARPSVAKLQHIYLDMVQEAVGNLAAADSFLADYGIGKSLPSLEAAILQVRKALEAVALASIAPYRQEYESFRAKADKQPDYTKDYHAGKIFKALSKINKDFYPLALTPAKRQDDGTLHFDRRGSGHLTWKRFEASYDRLGKHLHAHNPWSTDKNLQNLAADLPGVISETRALLELHAAFIRTPEFNGVWVVEVHPETLAPRVIAGMAEGEFVVTNA